MEEVETKYNNNTLRSVSQNGYIRFSIKANDTDENVKVHEAFKDFAKVECDDNYTLALRKLLEYYEMDVKYTIMYQKIEELEFNLKELENKLKEPKKENKKDEGVF